MRQGLSIAYLKLSRDDQFRRHHVGVAPPRALREHLRAVTVEFVHDVAPEQVVARFGEPLELRLFFFFFFFFSLHLVVVFVLVRIVVFGAAFAGRAVERGCR